MKNLRIALILIAIGIGGLFVVNLFSDFYPSPYSTYTIKTSNFQSNGERIYFTATSDSGKPILATMGQMTMRGWTMSCVECHGANGKGGSVRMMMWVYQAPDIRYSTLTTEGHGDHEGEKPYTDELIKRAITQGLDSEGMQLEPPMPLWQISEEDLDDLIDYLKTLK